ncbi:MAG TPA: transketolase C-terminal domain-containing protein [Sedimentisphaerales bacterium]|nr:transketolase C-terminal domain-containing protein [Sedimentisphaerales bacterium]
MMPEPVKRTDLREVMINRFIKAADNNVPILVVVSDSTSTAKIAPFQEKYPDRIVNVGIAEQNLVGVAAGLALGGFVAVTANAACFLVARANEQVKNDICYSDTNVKLVGLNAGVCYGALASTHHAIDDVSIMRGFGNIQIFAPSDPVETAQVFDYAIGHVGPVYIRMDSDKFPVLHDEHYQFRPGKADILRTGTDLTIFAMGSTVFEAFYAAEELAAKGISAEVLNVSSIRPLDRRQIIVSALKTQRVITVEEHSVHGGIGSIVSEIATEEGLGVKVTRLGITEGQFAKAGPRKDIRAHYKIDQKGIVETARRLLG